MPAEMDGHERCKSCRKTMFNKLYHCKQCSGRCKRRCKHAPGSSCRRCHKKKTSAGESHWSKVLQANEVNSNILVLPCEESTQSFHVEVSDVCRCNMKTRTNKETGVLSNLYEKFCQFFLSKKKGGPGASNLGRRNSRRRSSRCSGLGIDLGYVSFDEVVLNSPIESNWEFSFSPPYAMSSFDSCSCCSYSTTSSLNSATFGVALGDGQITDIVDSVIQSTSSERSSIVQPESAQAPNKSSPDNSSEESQNWNDVFLPSDKFTSLHLNLSGQFTDKVRERRHTSLTATHSCPQKPSSKGPSIGSESNRGLALCSTWPLMGNLGYDDTPFELCDKEEEAVLDSSLDRSQSDSISDPLGDCSIPFRDLDFGECVRSGRRQQIHRGRWHGDVIIHTFRDLTDEEVKFFLQEVTTMSMIRHDNITLFMGVCLEPTTLAVVSGVSRGSSLYHKIHLSGEKMVMESTLHVIRQIAQAMGYLHAKGIILRRLNTKNIFLDAKVKISIMDHGMSEQKCDRSDKGCIPRGHLTYIAPEILRTVRVEPPRLRTEAIFTRESDIFAFGTVMYEMFANYFPYRDMTSEAVIYQVSRGTRQSLTKLTCLTLFKDLIKDCWTHDSLYRPEFCEITKDLINNAALHKRHSSSEPEGIHRSGFRSRLHFT